MRVSFVTWVLAGLLAVTFGVSSARAQADIPTRLTRALEITEQRIDSAEALGAARPESPEARELEMARGLQSRARVAAARGRPFLAERATLDARTHADRAISMARGLPDPERVLVQLERTSELIDRAREKMTGCSESRATALLQVAGGMQERAIAAGDEGRFLAALQLTLSARQRVEKALRLCHVVEDLADAVRRGIRRTDVALEAARRTVAAGAPPQARSDLERAIELQATARAEQDEQHLERALQLTQLSRGIANRVARRQPPHGAPPPPPPGPR